MQSGATARTAVEAIDCAEAAGVGEDAVELLAGGHLKYPSGFKKFMSDVKTEVSGGFHGKLNELREAQRRLTYIVPLTLLLIALLVYAAVKTVLDTLIVLIDIPHDSRYYVELPNNVDVVACRRCFEAYPERFTLTREWTLADGVRVSMWAVGKR